MRRWFAKHGRDLPWRNAPTPYSVAVSEFMLQQTTVAAVIPYYLRWMKKWPSLDALAAASEDEILAHWQGLGYYSRARNLLQAARTIVGDYGGIFPSDPAILKKLPGFGDYTAAALAAFAYDKPVPVIDANIARVLARLGNISLPTTSTAGKNALRSLMQNILPQNRGGRIAASALMDIGAMLCRSQKTDCAACPLERFCLAQEPLELPIKSLRPPNIAIEEFRALIIKRGSIALTRSQGPWWRGLWILPAVPARDIAPIATIKFSVTRHRVTMHIITASNAPNIEFFPLTKLPPLPSPHSRAIEMLCVSHAL